MKPAPLVLLFTLLVSFCAERTSFAQPAPAPACAFDATQVVVELAPGFNAAGYGACGAGVPCAHLPPSPNITRVLLPATFAQTVQLVFNDSPPNFQLEMCKLDHIYIDTDASSVNQAPWGMRERRRHGIRHIGIPSKFFVDPSYSKFETATLNSLLQTNWTGIVSATPNTLELKIAAILAHEMAHIIWWVKPVPPGYCPSSGDDFFVTWGQVNRHPPRGFHRFGVYQAGNIPIEAFTFPDVEADVAVGSLVRLGIVYSDGNWPSLFGFVAPDEDFVETYKLFTLATRPIYPLTSLKVALGNAPDMVKVLNSPNTNLNTKGQWLAQCVGAP
jgi:hypothetical protein